MKSNHTGLNLTTGPPLKILVANDIYFQSLSSYQIH